MRPSKKQHLVETAADLFERSGFHATGIDAILKAGGIAKMTLYNHFASKDDLILAALALRDDEYRAWLVEQTEARAATPRERLSGIFSVLEDWFEGRRFHGCIFTHAAGEYSETDHPIHEQAALHKRFVYDYMVGLAKDAGILEARVLAQQLLILYDGAINVAHMLDAPIAARQAKRAATVLVDAALD